LPVFDAEITKTLSGTKHDGIGKDDKAWASSFAASPEFFGAAGVQLLTGRSFAASDVHGNLPVAILNRMAAERYFDHVGDALGRTITVHGSGDRAVTIVGVVADTRDSELTRTSPQIYLPFAQSPLAKMTLVMRSDRPDAAVQEIRTAMRRIEPRVAIANPKPMIAFVEEDSANNSVVTGLFIGFGLLALALASAGLYGVISYSVGQRQREIGVRLELGATPASIRTMVLRDGLKITGIGMIVGLVLAVVLAYASASVLFGVSPYDPKTFVSVIALVVIVAVAAVWAPALRAMRVDPATSLRAQ
jgi:putative ABC transport system permease protein